jgi:hypothetical protein
LRGREGYLRNGMITSKPINPIGQAKDSPAAITAVPIKSTASSMNRSQDRRRTMKQTIYPMAYTARR